MSPSGGDSEIVNAERATALMSRFAQAFRQAVPELFVEFGEEKAQEFIDELKFKISSQLFNHHPLNYEYYLGKLKLRLDPRILIATGEYLNNMVVERIEDDTSGVTFRCGMAAGIHQSSGLPLTTLQRYLEDGTSRMPARPHWRPQSMIFRARSNEMGRDFRNRLANKIRDSLQA
jgi:hypothetical protein